MPKWASWKRFEKRIERWVPGGVRNHASGHMREDGTRSFADVESQQLGVFIECKYRQDVPQWMFKMFDQMARNQDENPDGLSLGCLGAHFGKGRKTRVFLIKEVDPDTELFSEAVQAMDVPEEN